MFGAIRWYLRKVQARRRGRWDGKRGIPAGDEDKIYPPGEFRLKQTADRWFQEFARRWSNTDKRLKGEYCALVKELRRELGVLGEAETDVTKKQETHQKNMEEIGSLLESRRSRGGLEHEWRMSPTVYALFMAAIFIGEFPLNAIAFRLFGESEVFTWIMTSVLAFSLVGGAHLLGILLRIEDKTKVESWLTVISIIAPLGAIVAIALVRQGYLSELAREGRRFGLSPTGATVVFVLVNVLIYTVAAILSYFTHDPITRKVRETERPLQESQRRLAAIQKRVEQLEVRLARIRAEREKSFAAIKHEAELEKNAYEELIQEYRMGNLEARADGKVPPIFKNHPQFTIPPDLQELDWDCPEPREVVLESGKSTHLRNTREQV